LLLAWLTFSSKKDIKGAMDGFACVLCAEPIEPTLDPWLWVQITSHTELMTAHQTCYEHASNTRPSSLPGVALIAAARDASARSRWEAPHPNPRIPDRSAAR
jgi:hypothetical protein